MASLFFGCMGILLGHLLSVSAHATPLSYQPAASSLIEHSPDRVQIRFSERIEPGANSIAVFGPDGTRVEQGTAAVDPADAYLFSVRVLESVQGTYAVSWQVVSADDGHFTKGAFGFAIGKESEVSSALSQNAIVVTHSSTIWESITLWLELLGDALLLGTLLLYALVWRKTSDPAGDREVEDRVAKMYSRLIIAGLALVLLGTVSYLALKSINLQELQIASFWDALQSFVTTVAGKFTLYRLLAVGLFGVVFIVSRKKIFAAKRISGPEIILLLLLLLVGLFRARVSHAAASHFYPYASILINFVHLEAKSLWVGGLAAYLIMILPNASSKRAFLNFSKMMSIAFGLVGLTGMYVTWLHLKNFGNIITTDWGARCLVLLALAGVMTLLRFYHQFVVDRVLVLDASEKFRGRLSYTLGLETFVGVAFLFVTSLLIITTPPLSMKPGFERSAVSQGAIIRLAEYPYDSNYLLLEIERAADARPEQIKTLVVSVQNHEKSIGPLVVDAEQRFEGGYIIPKTSLSPHGNWSIAVNAQREGAYDATADFAVQFPADVEAKAQPPEVRSFDFFAQLHVVLALGTVFAAVVLLYWAAYLEKKISSSTRVKIELRKPGLINAFATAAVIAFIIWTIYPSILVSSFQIECERDGNVWHTMTPKRNGIPVPEKSFPGCMTDNGQNHFPDTREYRHFFKKD